MQAELLSDDGRDALAGELVLGVLEGEDRAAALRLMLSDRDFAAAVDGWRTRTGGLFDSIDAVEPPADAWDRIASRITPHRAADVRRLRWWQAGTVGASAVAAALAVALLLPGPVVSPPAAPQFAVAQLTGPIDGLRIAARYDPATAQLRVRATGMPDTPTAPELWIVPADGIPRSLGQIARDGETVIVVAEGHRSLINTQAGMGLSMEPPAPAPHDAPSAPMVARGAIDLI